MDVIDAAGLVYGDDNPVSGSPATMTSGALMWDISNFWKIISRGTNELKDLEDSDRDLLGGYLTFTPEEARKFSPFICMTGSGYLWKLVKYFNQCWSMQSIGVPKTDSHHIGAIIRVNSALWSCS
ncbi:MAG: hypothetical protein R2861_00675 [Desulfobacterales bacterium]